MVLADGTAQFLSQLDRYQRDEAEREEGATLYRRHGGVVAMLFSPHLC